MVFDGMLSQLVAFVQDIMQYFGRVVCVFAKYIIGCAVSVDGVYVPSSYSNPPAPLTLTVTGEYAYPVGAVYVVLDVALSATIVVVSADGVIVRIVPPWESVVSVIVTVPPPPPDAVPVTLAILSSSAESPTLTVTPLTILLAERLVSRTPFTVCVPVRNLPLAIVWSLVDG